MALANLEISSTERSALVKDRAIMQALVPILQHDEPDASCYAAAAVMNLCYATPYAATKAAVAGAVPSLLELLKN